MAADRWRWTVVLWLVLGSLSAAEERPYGKGLSEANQERLLLDDMENVAGWQNGSPVETTLSRSDKHHDGRYSLLFANLVDQTKGEKNYPIGWPRTYLDLSKRKLVDWSAYDAFECWIYVETSRPALPGNPLGVGFYHSGQKRSSSFPLDSVRKDAWVKVTIPVASLQLPTDVQRVQFNISESNYKHGDRVDFYINAPALVRYADPAVKTFLPRRQVIYTTERCLEADFTLAGYKGLQGTTVELSVGQGDAKPFARAAAKAARKGEAALTFAEPLHPGMHWARLDLRDAEGQLIDRQETTFRVVPGPF